MFDVRYETELRNTLNITIIIGGVRKNLYWFTTNRNEFDNGYLLRGPMLLEDCTNKMVFFRLLRMGHRKGYWSIVSCKADVIEVQVPKYS